jgi:Uma2 family endonuclease
MSATMKSESHPKQLVTVEEYHRMAEIGVLDSNSRVELIEGEIIDMAPIGISHNSVVDRLNRWLTLALGEHAIVRVQGSFRLSNITEPQPDLILLKLRDDFYAAKFAAGEDTLLVIEVSDTTFRYDRNVKVPLYARHGIPEVWIVDLESSRLHCFRQLTDQNYAEVTATDRPGVVTLPGASAASVDLSRLLDL